MVIETEAQRNREKGAIKQYRDCGYLCDVALCDMRLSIVFYHRRLLEREDLRQFSVIWG